MAQLEIRMLGGFDVTLDGRPVDAFESASTRALFAHLAAEVGRQIPRGQLAEMFWPERPAGKARANLRHSLTVIRRAIGDHRRDTPIVVASTVSVGLDPAADVWIDVRDFEQLADTPARQSGVVAAWERAAILWRGPFLGGFDPALGEEWETWLLATRNRFDARAVGLLDRLADAKERSGEYERSLHLTRAQLAIDRWHDPAQIRLLRLLARSGRTGEALAHADKLLTELADELGVEPTAGLSSAVDALRHGEFAEPLAPVPDLAAPPGDRPPEQCVARDEDLDWLSRSLEDSLGGSGRMAFLRGPAGSGKSVLLRAFAAEARRRMPDLEVLAGDCNSYSGPGDPYLPFRQILGLLCGDLDDAWSRGRLTAREASLLWSGVPDAVETLIDDGPDLLATLVDGPALVRRFERSHPDHALLETLRAVVDEAGRRTADPGRPRQPLIEQCVRVLTRLAARRPLLIIVDDAHWADSGTIDLLRHLSDRVAAAPVLVVVAFRPREITGDVGRPDLVAMLAQETQAHSSTDCLWELSGSRHFVDAWLDTEPNRLDESFRERMHRTTGGHALFTVETVAAMQERGDLVRDAENRWVAGNSISWDRLPPRVEAAVAARTMQLPAELRHDLEAASIQGRVFLADVVAVARGSTPDAVGGRLAQLTVASHPLVEYLGTVDAEGRRLDRYRFRHDVFQRTMEDGISGPDRARLHEAAGRALADLFAERSDEVAVDLARHFDAAGLVDEAIVAHERAGRRALRLSATAEGVVHLRRAIELLDGQDESAARNVHTLGLLSALGTYLQALAGYNASETHDVYERVRSLIPVVGTTMESAQALGALIAVDGLRARYGAATEGAEHLLEMSRTFDAAPIEAVAHTQLGWMGLMTARLGEAGEHLDRAIGMYDDEWDLWLTDAVGFHVAATALSWRALQRWYSGRPDQALCDGERAIELARRADSPFSLVFALQVAGSTLQEHVRDGPRILEFSAEAGAVAEREGFEFYTAASQLHHGLGSCHVGNVHRGLSDLEAGLSRWAELGTRAFRPWITANSMHFYIADGRLDAARNALRNVEVWLSDGEERLAALWLPLARGRIRRADGDATSAEQVLRAGLTFLLEAGAHGVRLRTATELGDLLCDQQRYDEAREILVPALGAVDGGEDTADVIEARDVLERTES